MLVPCGIAGTYGDLMLQAESQESRSAREDLEAQLEAAQTRAQAAVDAAASAQARAAAAEAARDEAVSARAAAERARRQTEAQAHAAAEAAEAERNERAAAEGLSEQLQADANRRAKVFHNAVKAAVAKVQGELEEERDALEARCASFPPVPAIGDRLTGTGPGFRVTCVSVTG